MRPIAADVHMVGVHVSVGNNRELVEKTAEPFELSFGTWTRVDPVNHVLGWWVQIPQGKGDCGGQLSSVKYK